MARKCEKLKNLEVLVSALAGKNLSAVSRSEVLECAKKLGKPTGYNWVMAHDAAKSGQRGVFNLVSLMDALKAEQGVSEGESLPESVPASSFNPPQESEPSMVMENVVRPISEAVVIKQDRMVPSKNPMYVQPENYSVVEKILKSRMFYPLFITGLSGNGKTLMVSQACANLNLELYRVNITIETDEDDLIGGFRLQDGNTVWNDGPVVQAMKRGAVLLLDEIDLASNKIMCLQSVLEGNGIYIKKINQQVKPANGFTVIATANTKGKGCENGSFVGTNILNEAFLDRFPITLFQDYPSEKEEVHILELVQKDLTDGAPISDEVREFAKNLVKWAGTIRDANKKGSVDDVITTRRLVNILTAFNVFDDKAEAINRSIERFDEHNKQSFLKMYSAIDPDVQIVED